MKPRKPVVEYLKNALRIPENVTHLTSRHFFCFCFLRRPTQQEAKSVCESRNGKLVEIESQAELDYLSTHVYKDYFYLGAQKDPKSGLWHWMSSGKPVNFGIFNPVYYGREQVIVAHSKGGNFVPNDTNSKRTVICETPSKYVNEFPEPPLDTFPDSKFEAEEYVSGVTNSTYLFSKFALPWMSARTACEEQGAYLAEIETPQENNDLLH